jgi:putative flippase GtrA
MELGLAVLVATVLARVVSSLFNYTFNRSAVFGSKGRVTHTIVRYYILCVCQMLVSYLLVLMLTRVLALGSVLTVVAKAVVDTLLFILSFQIQRCWVFK